MENDYECPRCHNIFPIQNKTMHDIRCTENNPAPLDASRIKYLNEQKEKENENNEIKEEIKPHEIKQEEKKEEKINSNNEIKKPPSGEFPEVFECNICHQIFMESERKDHMYCHNLEKEENNRQNNFEVSPEEIAQQKEIEKQIEREKRYNQENNQRNNQRNYQHDNQRNYQNNQRNNQRNINDNFFDNQFFPNLGSSDMDNNFGNLFNNLSNAISGQQRQNINNFERNRRNNNPNNHSNSNVNIRIETIGPHGQRIVQTYNQPQSEMNIFSNNRRRNISFIDFNDGIFGNIFSDFLRRMGSRENPTDEEILNELPETQIEDVNKLDPEKKNCIICLEDFKNGDKAIILPCIHLFHTNCIKNWLKTQNTCPICKFKLTGENINSSG